MTLNNKPLKQIISEEIAKALKEEDDFEDRHLKTIRLRNAVIAHLEKHGGFINRKRAMESDPSFDNLITQIIDMVDWD